jgi:hypothetical protein
MDIISLPWTLSRATVRYFARTASKLSGSNIKNVNPLYYTFQGLAKESTGERSRGMPGSFIIASFMASVFGALHLIAWSFPFPTTIARDLWRASSIYSAASPWVILFISYITFSVIGKSSTPQYKILAFINKILIVLYIPARIILGVVAFWGLNRPPLTANQTVDWSRYIPHV